MDPFTTTERRRRRTGDEQAADTPLFAPTAPPKPAARPSPELTNALRTVMRPGFGKTAPIHEPTPLPHNGTATSEQAAEGYAPQAGSARVRIYVYVRDSGARGATREELVRALGMKENTVNPRVAELLKTGMVREQGQRDGRMVLVVATEPRA